MSCIPFLRGLHREEAVNVYFIHAIHRIFQYVFDIVLYGGNFYVTFFCIQIRHMAAYESRLFRLFLGDSVKGM